MFIPYSTDAPLYHAPIATTSLIVVNTLLLFLWPVHFPEYQGSYSLPDLYEQMEAAHDYGELSDEEWREFQEAYAEEEETGEENAETYDPADDFDWRTLHYGDGIKPWQWLTGNFMHADFWHLLGNMLILWPFGALIEGKIGWKRFLLLYAGIGIFQSMVEQFLFLFLAEPTFSLGASAIIFGLIAIALVWAPMNEVNCFLLLGFRPIMFALPVSVYCAFSIAFELLILYFTYDPLQGGLISSSFFHAFGAFIGLAVGIVMVRKEWVDCENYDFFTVYFGNPDAPREEKVDETGLKAARLRSANLGLEQIRQILREGGDPALAYRAHLKLGHSNPDWYLPEEDLLEIIQSFLKQKRSQDALPAMIEYARRGGAKETPVRLRIAHVMVEGESRPGQALQVLSKVDPAKLGAQDRQRYDAIRKKAQEMKAAGVVEPAAEDI
ncbi:rhomboid family intramembrane serine protease [Blastopirellula sp. JC732]|uniref:Rhomboid family intramembrane serine protease n=1 Tax=Blastopirellula sediminis TaxID=2894196 RepID=A0A9X1SIW3_9BACT|nr:rhomboid family intramembrane serine protease [Blastopirellula sediminis]MCC9604664.1 rhomboid family intramembrane serine protease [Blastopirellula sediminis]MCC9632038.1 rhomboid family intramembrane serine protease [Blastopirellula sediminis]